MTDLFDPKQYLEVRKPRVEASTLPPQCYTSEAFFRREQETLFRKNWQFVCRAERLKKVGSYICHESHGRSVIIIRSKDNQVKAFTNSCRHRGSRLLNDAGECGRIVCPYHSWVYALDGQLIGTPDMTGVLGFDKSEFSLIEMPVENWGGFLFINPDSAAQSLKDYMGNFPDFFQGHQTASMRQTHTIEFEVQSNWKLLAENALEAYHTGTVHRETLGQQQSREIESRGNWTGLLVEDEASVATLPGQDPPFPYIDGLSAYAKSGAFFTLLYPSTQFVFAQDCMWWLDFKPASVSETKLEIGACFPETTIAQHHFEETSKLYADRWHRATAEDNAICEAQQQGQVFQRKPGRYAPSEFAVRAFSNWVLDQVLVD